VREAALTALAVIGGEESLRAIQAACPDSEPRVRQAAASVLAAATTDTLANACTSHR
jgi:HEAT repeat protein